MDSAIDFIENQPSFHRLTPAAAKTKEPNTPDFLDSEVADMKDAPPSYYVIATAGNRQRTCIQNIRKKVIQCEPINTRYTKTTPWQFAPNMMRKKTSLRFDEEVPLYRRGDNGDSCFPLLLVNSPALITQTGAIGIIALFPSCWLQQPLPGFTSARYRLATSLHGVQSSAQSCSCGATLDCSS